MPSNLEQTGWSARTAMNRTQIGSSALKAALLYCDRRKEAAEDKSRQWSGTIGRWMH